MQSMFTTIGIASQVIEEIEVDIGECSSHYHEHNFVNV